jgi:arylformamidase
VLYRNYATQQELDAQYDVEGIHPDLETVFNTFVGASESARETLEARFDQPYGPTRDEHADVYPAGDASGSRPQFVFIHGGYWRAFTSKEFALVAPGPVARGIDVVVVTYALAPKVTIEEITREGRAAVKWVAEHCAEWGGDPDRIFVGGHSAGGQQTAMLLQTDWEREYGLPADVIKGGIAVSGVFDLRPLPFTLYAPALQLTHRVIEWQSPMLLDAPLGAPLLVTWGGGETDEFRRQSTDYLAKLEAAGADARGLELPGKDHFEAIMGFNAPDGDLTEELARMALHHQ